MAGLRDLIAQAERIDGSALANFPTDKPVYDWELAEIGQTMKALTAIHNQTGRLLKRLEEEQSRRAEELRIAEIGRGDCVDAGYAWFVKHPAPQPTATQHKILRAFELVLRLGDADTLREAYGICRESYAVHTSWRSEHGETVAVAYERRLKELDGTCGG